MHVYIDESGDLGFSFSSPYRRGGSSRHLTIAFLLATKENCKYTRRFTQKFKKKHNIAPGNELKGSLLKPEQLEEFANGAAKLLRDHPECRTLAITVKKARVIPHIQEDPNKLYNWMIRLILLDEIKTEPEVRLIPDPRSIKVKSGHSMIDYLQTTLWFEMGSTTRLIYNPLESHKSFDLQFIDVVSNIVWRHHERGKSEPFRILDPHITCKRLFF